MAGRDVPAVTAGFLACLGDPDWRMRRAVVDALASRGAPAVTDGLIGRLDPDPSARRRLRDIGRDAAHVIGRLLTRLNDPDPDMRQSAVHLFCWLTEARQRSRRTAGPPRRLGPGRAAGNGGSVIRRGCTPRTLGLGRPGAHPQRGSTRDRVRDCRANGQLRLFAAITGVASWYSRRPRLADHCRSEIPGP